MAGALLGLSGCYYGAGYYGDGYVNSYGYDCDPYAPFDTYYACDYGYGFANIGFGGGWYDHYFYPGYGFYVFDRVGKRHVMRDHHRRYWARERARYGSRHHGKGRYARGRNRTPEQRERWRNLTPEQRAERREQRRARGEGRRGSGQAAVAPVRRNDGVRTRSGGRQAARGGDGGTRTRAVRRPTIAAEQRQARPQRASRPARVQRAPPGRTTTAIAATVAFGAEPGE